MTTWPLSCSRAGRRAMGLQFFAGGRFVYQGRHPFASPAGVRWGQLLLPSSTLGKTIGHACDS
jgi:hypothetical protein